MSVIGLYIYSVVLHVSDIRIMLSFIKLRLSEKRVWNSYEVAFLMIK